nr:zinc-regulated transporter 1 [Quercus suber]
MDAFDPSSVNLTGVTPDDDLYRQIVCYIQLGENEYQGSIGVRISAIFVVLIVSSAVTFFPVIATRTRVGVPLYVYLFARYFGAGVIVATAFIQ